MNSFLKQKSLLIVFAYAPAGFGHLRVTDALYHGLPKGVTPPLLLGSQDTSITVIHRIMSTYPIVRFLTEWAEQGIAEDIITFLYRLFLRSQTNILYKQMITILGERLEPPTTILIIATHFGLAHQLAALKEKLEKEKKVRIILVVQVTDDSPHHIWYVPGADMIFVPSEKTKAKLIKYGNESHLPPVKFELISYPLSPLLDQKISQHQMMERVKQVQKENSSTIHVSLPISGAAVGTSFFTIMIDEMHILSDRFVFHILSKEAPYTKKFIQDMKERPYVKLETSLKDQQIVDMYEELYKNENISLEITKPSEQAFKALFNCEKKGASILLLSEPVGRQEYDNLDFLRRHSLIPLVSEEEQLWKLAEKNTSSPIENLEPFLVKAQSWRGISLPRDPKHAACFVWWCFGVGLFNIMISCKVNPQSTDVHALEMSPNGVNDFWKEVEKLLSTA